MHLDVPEALTARIDKLMAVAPFTGSVRQLHCQEQIAIEAIKEGLRVLETLTGARLQGEL